MVTQIQRTNYEVRVGMFTLFALILLLWGWSWLKSFSLFHPPQRFIVQFHDVAGLNANAPVNINGVRVGTVEQLDLKGKGQVMVHLKIKSEEIPITEGSNFTIQTIGLVGAKYVEITLPELKPGEAPPPVLTPDQIVIGEDPVRVELIVNKIASNLSNVDISGMETHLRSNLDKLATAAESITTTSHKINNIADSTRGVTEKADLFFDSGSRSFTHISSLADDFRGTSKRMNKILDNPTMSTDLRVTAEKAKQAADSIQVAMHELNTTLSDQALRQDVSSLLTKLNTSTENVYKSLQIVHKVAGDQGLRNDIKDLLADARQTMDRVEKLVSEPGFGADLRETMAKLRVTAGHVDLVARQLNQVLDRKNPMLHMMWGRPGYIKTETQTTTETDTVTPEKQK
jgi:phospholipid/cholesterol/gamma-HCH transport system substrate-binding protein